MNNLKVYEFELFLTNDKTKNGRDRRNETLFIDARNLGTMETRVLKVLTKEDVLAAKANILDDLFMMAETQLIERIEEENKTNGDSATYVYLMHVKRCPTLLR